MEPKDVYKLLRLKEDALDHIPIYGIKPACDAITYMIDLEQRNVLRPGVYYIALVDLCGSMAASAALGLDVNKKRIEEFISMTIDALSATKPISYAQFVKDIGDASLFIFSSFKDVLIWAFIVGTFQKRNNDRYKNRGEPEIYQMESKIAVHVGEVSFGEGNNPIALAVNQVFKIEKLFGPNQMGITDTTRQIIGPYVDSSQISVTEVTKTVLPGDVEEKPVWLLSVRDETFADVAQRLRDDETNSRI